MAVMPCWPLLVLLATDPQAARAQPDLVPRLDLTPRPDRLPPANRDEVVIGDYHLVRQEGGGYVAETEAFVARISADGAVAFGEKAKTPSAAVAPVMVVAGAVKSATSKTGRGSRTGRGLSSLISGFTQPKLTFSDEDLRHDRHHAQKMTFLDATASFREGLHAANDQAELARFRHRADAAAADRRTPARERRRTLFELWLECDEAERGAPARAAVEAVARERFPAGSADAYGEGELAELNRRAPAGHPFAPYAPEAAPRP
jgi:hypothetical protein